MSAKSRIESFKKFSADRREAMQVEGLMSLAKKHPDYNRFNAETQSQFLDDVINGAKKEWSDKLAKLHSDVMAEAREAKAAADRAKHPLRFSSGAFDREAGQRQQANALLFLGTRPSADRIAAEVRTALDRGEIDYAYTIEENYLNDAEFIAPGFLKLDKLQEDLKEKIDAAFISFDGAGKIKELETEANEYATAEKIAAELEQSLLNGWKVPNSLTLMNMISEEEQKVMAADFINSMAI